jgi:hypothetical protein
VSYIPIEKLIMTRLDATLDLMDENGRAIPSRIKMKLSLISESPEVFMESVDADVARLDGNGILPIASDHIQAAASVGQTSGAVVQTLGNCVGPLGQALQLIVKIMDNVADVCLCSSSKPVGMLTRLSWWAGTSHIESLLDSPFFGIQGEYLVND